MNRQKLLNIRFWILVCYTIFMIFLVGIQVYFRLFEPIDYKEKMIQEYSLNEITNNSFVNVERKKRLLFFPYKDITFLIKEDDSFKTLDFKDEFDRSVDSSDVHIKQSSENNAKIKVYAKVYKESLKPEITNIDVYLPYSDIQKINKVKN